MKNKILSLIFSTLLGANAALASDFAGFEIIETGNKTIRREGVTPNMLIINWSGLSLEDLITCYQTDKSNASNHFVTAPGRAIQMIDPTTHASWAAGGKLNEWEKSTAGLNHRGLALTMAHPGFSTINEIQAREFVPFDEELFTTTAQALQKIASDFSIPPRYVLGHGDVGGFADGADQCEIDRYGEATPRKHAPGPLFPWGRLHEEYGVGAWLSPEELEASKQAIESANFNDLLTYMEEYGYPVVPADDLSLGNVRSIKTAGAHFWGNIDNGGTGSDYDQLPDDYRDATAWMYGLVKKYVRTS